MASDEARARRPRPPACVAAAALLLRPLPCLPRPLSPLLARPPFPHTPRQWIGCSVRTSPALVRDSPVFLPASNSRLRPSPSPPHPHARRRAGPGGRGPGCGTGGQQHMRGRRRAQARTAGGPARRRRPFPQRGRRGRPVCGESVGAGCLGSWDSWGGAGGRGGGHRRDSNAHGSACTRPPRPRHPGVQAGGERPGPAAGGGEAAGPGRRARG